MIPVGLKYITSRQVFEVSYEGQRRRFTLASITPKGSPGIEAVNSLTRGLETLSLGATPQIWLVTWDTMVTITRNDPKGEPQAVHKARYFCGRLFLHNWISDLYSCADSQKSRFWSTNPQATLIHLWVA